MKQNTFKSYKLQNNESNEAEEGGKYLTHAECRIMLIKQNMNSNNTKTKQKIMKRKEKAKIQQQKNWTENKYLSPKQKLNKQ